MIYNENENKKLSYEERERSHNELLNSVLETLRDKGLYVHLYGAEKRIIKTFYQMLLSCGRDDSARFIRFQPDAVVIDSLNNKTYLMDIKSTVGKYPNISYEYNSWDIAKRLISIGVKYFIVCRDMEKNFKAVWTSDIVPSGIFVPNNRKAEQWILKEEAIKNIVMPTGNVKGSGTAYVIIPYKELKSYLSLDKFIDVEILKRRN